MNIQNLRRPEVTSPHEEARRRKADMPALDQRYDHQDQVEQWERISRPPWRKPPPSLAGAKQAWQGTAPGLSDLWPMIAQG